MPGFINVHCIQYICHDTLDGIFIVHGTLCMLTCIFYAPRSLSILYIIDIKRSFLAQARLHKAVGGPIQHLFSPYRMKIRYKFPINYASECGITVLDKSYISFTLFLFSHVLYTLISYTCVVVVITI